MALIQFASAALLVFAGILSTYACGPQGEPLSQEYHRSPFVARFGGDFRFSYWEKWGTVSLDAKTDTPVFVGFSPIPDRQSSKILGDGWAFPLLESTCLPTGNGTFRLRRLDGEFETLQNPDASAPRRADWTAKTQGNIITVTAPCGCTFIYQDGALIQVKSPEGVISDFINGTDGTRKINVNGKTVLSLRQDFDNATGRKRYHLAIGDKHAVLEIGQRPVLVEGKTTQIESLVSVKFDDTPEKRFDFKEDEVLIGRNLHKWDKATSYLTARGERKHAVLEIVGIKCLKTIYENGYVTLDGESKDGKTSVRQSGTAPITIIEYVPHKRQGLLVRETKKISQLDKDGRAVVVREFWFNKDGEPSRTFVNDGTGGIFYERTANTILAYREKEKLLWKKTFDAQRRLIEYSQGTRLFKFDYPNDDNVQVSFSEDDTKFVSTLPLRQVFPTSDDNMMPLTSKKY
jgi:hypothetical protein